MKVTVKQLKQLIREQVEEAGRANRNRSLKDFVMRLGDAQGWFDEEDRGRSVENVKDVYIDGDVLVIAFKNGDTMEPYISDL